MRAGTPAARARRLTALAGGVLLVGAAPVGCAGSASDATAEQAREALYATLNETQRLLDVDFANQDDPTARGCALGLWQEGDQFPALRVSAGATDASVTVATVSQYWDELGYALTSSSVGSVRELQGENDSGEVVILRVSADAITLQGESECRPH
jgi:hypothetical protein